MKAVVSHQHRYGEHYQKVKEIIASGALGRVHTVYGTATGWMTHMLSHLIDYTRWFNDYSPGAWVMAQAAGRAKFGDNHPSPDYIAGFVQFANGVRGIYECGAGAPDLPEVANWWGKCRIGAQGTEGFAEVLTSGGWRAVTKSGGYQSGEGAMNYDLDMPPYIQEMADWLDDDLPGLRDRVGTLSIGHRGRADRVAAHERHGRDRGAVGEGAAEESADDAGGEREGIQGVARLRTAVVTGAGSGVGESRRDQVRSRRVAGGPRRPAGFHARRYRGAHRVESLMTASSRFRAT